MVFLTGVLVTALPTPSDVAAQVPTPAEARRLLQENPELVRQRLLASGLSQGEIRARLTAAGLPSDGLDAFLSGEPLDAATAFDANAISSLQTLGIAVETADGLELVGVTSGLQIGAADETSEDGLPIFGHDVFTRATSQFQPLLSGPVPDDYKVGPGDQLVLLLTGEVEIARELVVTREGFVVVQNVGRISIANLSISELQTLFRDRLSDAYSGINRGTTTVDVSVTGLRTNQIYVIGEVEQAGAYQLASVATVTNALYAAGGPTRLGNLRDVRIQRRDGDDASLDLYPYLLEGDISGDIILEQGDVVFVPLKGRRVQVRGSAVRPAEYELSETDDLLDVLMAAGGFAPEANRKRITIHRVVRPAERGPGLGDRISIDLGLAPSDDPFDPSHFGGVLIPPVGLQDGDLIEIGGVASITDGYYVSIGGWVAEPQTTPWREGMTIRDLMDLARGPTVGADLREAVVTRLPDDPGHEVLANLMHVPLDSSYLSQRDADGRYVGPPGLPFPPAGASPEFVLAPYDRVVIRRQPEFEMPTSVSITGEVSVPGRYTLLSRHDRVADLVTRAGLILDTGYLEGARLYRSEGNLGRIDLDLPAAMTDPEGDENLALQPGDSLHIPMYSPTVVVQGAVNSPVSVLYRDGQDFDYYIAAAGGFRSDADEGRTSIQFANGLARTRLHFLFWSRFPEPEAGSVISVPSKDPADRLDTRGLIADLVAILGSVVTVIVVVTQ